MLTERAKDKAEKAKAYIESKYRRMGDEESQRKEGNSILLLFYMVAWQKLNEKMVQLNLSEAEQELIRRDILHKEADLNRKM